MDARKILSISKLSLALVLSLVVVRTIMTLSQTREIFGPASASGRENVQVKQSKPLNKLSAEDYEQIITSDLFGGASVSASNIDASSNLDIDPSVSKELGLELVGTISGAPEAARVIIKNTKTKVIETYRTGQRIADARIEAIGADAVVLEYKGQTRVLGLNSWRSKGADGRYTSSADSGINVRPSSNDAVITSKAGYIQKLLSKAVISPYVVKGRVEGLEITGLENLSESETFGLKNGDIVHSVNGHNLTSKQKAFQILKKARSQDAISIEMSRNNRVNEISWPLR